MKSSQKCEVGFHDGGFYQGEAAAKNVASTVFVNLIMFATQRAGT
jgi:hypothetical protein